MRAEPLELVNCIWQLHLKKIEMCNCTAECCSSGSSGSASSPFALPIPLELPVLLWDERWSTSSAEAAMIGQDMSRSKRAARIDSHAAAVILQGAIDTLAGGGF